MNHRLIPDALRPVAEKIEAQERISDADAVALYESSELNALGMMANVVRERKNGNYASYIHNRYINYSNICILSCQFCAFAAKKRDPPAFEWLDVHRTWHEMGGRSTCTMLYGHIETLAHRVDHLSQLRQLQDETGGFTGFVPFAFEPQTTILAHIKPATAIEQLRNLAVSRTYLDNIDHITAYWVSIGLPLAQVSLSYGVDDLHGTILEEKIFHMAGATTPQQQTVAALEHAIREAGREPVQRDSHYRHVDSSKNGSATGARSAEAEFACV